MLTLQDIIFENKYVNAAEVYQFHISLAWLKQKFQFHYLPLKSKFTPKRHMKNAWTMRRFYSYLVLCFSWQIRKVTISHLFWNCVQLFCVYPKLWRRIERLRALWLWLDLVPNLQAANNSTELLRQAGQSKEKLHFVVYLPNWWLFYIKMLSHILKWLFSQ